jgi:hypothetical protein
MMLVSKSVNTKSMDERIPNHNLSQTGLETVSTSILGRMRTWL